MLHGWFSSESLLHLAKHQLSTKRCRGGTAKGGSWRWATQEMGNKVPALCWHCMAACQDVCAVASCGKGMGGKVWFCPSASCCLWSLVNDCASRSHSQDFTLGCAWWEAKWWTAVLRSPDLASIMKGEWWQDSVGFTSSYLWPCFWNRPLIGSHHLLCGA